MSRNSTDIQKPSSIPKPPSGKDEQLSLFSTAALAAVQKEATKWRREVLEPATSNRVAWKKDFTTVSGMDVNPLATPTDVADLDFGRDLAFPGEFPYTRGIHPSGYRGKLWTMRQFAGFGTAKQSNERYHYLLSQGQHGLSIALHLPTLYGYDSDHHFAAGEVGKCGVAVDSLADMETIFDGIDLEKVTVSMTINSTAPILLAMYLAVAEKHGADWKKISGTLQNDILKEYIAQKEYIYPPRPSMRLITDIFKFCADNVPKYNTISISGYHIREAGSTALQELAFTLRDGIEYVEHLLARGLLVDAFAPRLSFFFN
ncbi:MAG: methylmalonyl-CoA mutase family protein, partial [Thermoanaerobaculia bacterium]